VNIDETTYMFSPKVLDRANTIEFRVLTDDLQRVPPATSPIDPASGALAAAFLAAASRPAVHTASGAQVADWLRELHSRLSLYGREFGHRTFAEATRFAELLSAAGNAHSRHALDLQVLQKVLPRYHGSVRELSEALNDLGAWCFVGPGQTVPTSFDAAEPPAGEPALPESFNKVHRMAKRLRANHFVSFAE
jgi:5-methylcytosine-specific restriction protein B